MRIPNWTIPVAMALCGLLLNVTSSYGKPEYTKQTKKPCTACHVSAKSKDLNATGKCWAEKKSFDGCATPGKK